MGTNQGFKIEEIFIHELNNKKFSDIKENFKDILKKIDNTVIDDDVFKAVKKEGVGIEKKTDISIKRNDIYFANISLKKGSGNSVHQEHINNFSAFLNKNNVPNKDLDKLKIFIWGDGSVDGSIGKNNTTLRMSSTNLKKKYPQIISDINTIFQKNKKIILQRVFCGEINPPDFLIYTQDKYFKNVIVKKMDAVINFHMGQSVGTSKNIKLGALNFQTWNRCLTGQEKNGNKNRHDLQFKWSDIYSDLK